MLLEVEVDGTRESRCHLASAPEMPTVEHTVQGLLVPDAELRDRCADDADAYTVSTMYFRQLSQRSSLDISRNRILET